ncbi:MAG TPA: VTT domain-containing protein [Rectinemataceae bacterium]|nr:VTT domain-containing protein [Rectinemataceae bacterium]
MERKRSDWFGLVAFPLFIALVVAVVVLMRHQLLGLFRDRELIRSWIEARGTWGGLAFVGLQVFQVVIFVVPGEIVQIAGGYAFGFWQGTGLSLLGITLGSLVNFAAGRFLGRPFVERIFDAGRVAAVERVTGSGKAAAGFFLLFVIPGIPKDVLCYVAGMAGLGLPSFLGVSMLGRLPGILGSSFMGSATFDRDYRAALVVLAAASLLFVAGLFYRERIESWLARLLHRGDDSVK